MVDDIVAAIHLFGHLYAAAIHHPGEEFRGWWAEGPGGEEVVGGVLALVGARRAVGGIESAFGNRVVIGITADDRTGLEHLDVEIAVGHLADPLGDPIADRADHGDVLAEGGMHLPAFLGLGLIDGGEAEACRQTGRANGRQHLVGHR